MSKDFSYSSTVGQIKRYNSEEDYKNGNFYNATKIESKKEGERKCKNTMNSMNLANSQK